MELKQLFKNNQGLALPAIDKFLMTTREEDNRAHHVNSPSQTGNCNRQNYYARIGEEVDNPVPDPKSERIFDNGDDVHERIQKYLSRAGVLLMDEVPLRNDEYNIQGHTDGLLWDSQSKELVILEIKSINENGYKTISQKGAKEEHIKQANVYAYVLEQHRKYLRERYPTQKALLKSINKRKKYYRSLYQHLQDGMKYTKEEKIAKKVREHMKADMLLWGCKNPITRISFLYENKNTQEIKEILVRTDSKLMKNVLYNYKVLEFALEVQEPPSREGKSKSDQICRWCPYKVSCWN